MSEEEDQPPKPRIRVTIGDLTDSIGMDATANLARSAGHTIGLGQDVIAQVAGQGFGVGALDLSRLLASGTKLTLGQALIGDWRLQLQDAIPKTQLSVATEMTRAVAGLNWPNLLIDLDWTKTLAVPGRTALDEALGQIRETWGERLRSAAFLATQALSALVSVSDQRQREYQQSLWRLEWWMPPSMDYPFLVEIGELARANRRRDLRRRMLSLAESPRFRSVVDDWWESEAFRERKRFLLDGLRDHRAGRYRVSIPTLLPHLEGIASAVFDSGGKLSTKVPRLVKKAIGDQDFFMGDALVDVLTLLWVGGKVDAKKTRAERVRLRHRQLNRPLILHGTSTTWPSEINSAKLLFTFDLLASLVKDAEKAKTKRPKTGAGLA